MNATRAAGLAAVLGGLVWAVAALIHWGENVNRAVYGVGFVCFVLALAAMGYALVEKAPVWLRAVVCVATPALGYAVWATVKDAFDTDYLSVLLAGLVMAGVGAVTVARTRGVAVEQPVHGHRAAR